eukprot:10792704-Alexandrium_andersonii.AAC.1
MAALARQRPTRVVTSVGTSSMKAGVGARLAEKAATTTGPKATHHRNGLIGPPMPTPVKTGRQTRLPFGKAN